MTITKIGTMKTGINVSHRKEKSFTDAYILLDKMDCSEVATLRIYITPATTYAVIWVYGITSGSGKASGSGYHKASAATSSALEAAGIEMSEDISGRGESLMKEALLAIGRELGYDECKIIHAHS